MKRLLRLSLVVMLATAAAKCTGLLREAALAWAFGAGTLTDAFVLSFTLPNLTVSFLNTALGVTFLSVSEGMADDPASRERFACGLLTALAGIGLVFTVLLCAFPMVFVRALAAAAPEETARAAASLLRWMAWSVVPILLSSVLAAHLEAHDRFFPAAAYLGVSNVTMIAGILVSRVTGQPAWMGAGLAVGSLLALGCLAASCRGTGLRFRPVFDLKSPALRRFFRLLAPVMLSSVASQLGQVAAQNVASSLEAGSLTALHFADKVQNVFSAFVGMAVATAFYPRMARSAAAGERTLFAKQLRGGLGLLLLTLPPLAAGVVLLARPLVGVLFARGAFGPDDVSLTAACLRWYAPTILAMNLAQFLQRAYYARQKTRCTAMVSVLGVGVAVNVAAIFLLVKPLGVRGLALASGVSGLSMAACLAAGLRTLVNPLPHAVYSSGWAKEHKPVQEKP